MVEGDGAVKAVLPCHYHSLCSHWFLVGVSVMESSVVLDFLERLWSSSDGKWQWQKLLVASSFCPLTVSSTSCRMSSSISVSSTMHTLVHSQFSLPPSLMSKNKSILQFDTFPGALITNFSSMFQTWNSDWIKNFVLSNKMYYNIKYENVFHKVIASYYKVI